MHFPEKSGRLSSVGPEILVFSSHCSANFQPILDCFMPNVKYEDSENIKTDRVTTVVFNLNQIKQKNFFGTLGTTLLKLGDSYLIDFKLIQWHKRIGQTNRMV